MLVVSPEFAASPSFAPERSGIHQAVLFQITLVELFALAILLLPAVAGGGGIMRARIPLAGMLALVGGTIIVLVSIWTGLDHGSRAPFGDWRALALGLAFWLALARGPCRTREGRSHVANVFIGTTALWSAWLLTAYAAGGGVVVPILGRIPVWDHPTLEFMVACSVLCVWLLLDERPDGPARILWYFGAIAPSVVVILSFRRFAWIELAVGMAVVIALMHISGRRSVRLLQWIVVTMVCLAAGLTLGPSEQDFSSRLSSIATTGATAKGVSYAGTNASHLDDIRDGWQVIKRHPLLGLGVGATYVGTRTSSWKNASGMVHNGPVNVWVKFGIAGLVMYLGGMAVLLIRSARELNASPLAGGVLAYLCAQLLITTTVFNWPFDTLAGSILFFTLVALVHPSLRSS